MFSMLPTFRISSGKKKGLARPLLHPVRILQLLLMGGVIIIFTALLTIALIVRPVLREQATDIARSTIQRAEADLIATQTSAKNLSVQLLLDEPSSALLNARNRNVDLLTVNAGMEQLRLLMSSNSNIHSIYLINGRAGLIFSTTYGTTAINSESFLDQEILEWIQDRSHIRKMLFRADVPDSFDFKLSSNTYTFCAPNRYVDDRLESCVVINMSLRSLQKQIASYLEFQQDAYLRVASDNDTLLEVCTIQDMDPAVLNVWSQDTIRDSISDQDDQLGGTDYSLLNYHSAASGLHFTLIRPHSVVYGSLDKTQTVLAWIIVLCVLLEIMLSLGASRHIRAAFSKIEREKQHMSARLMTEEQMREKFWEKYLMGLMDVQDANFANLRQQHITGDKEKGSLCILVLDTGDGPVPMPGSGEHSDIIRSFADSFSALKPEFLFQQREMVTFLLRTETEEVLSILPYIPEKFSQQMGCNFQIVVSFQITPYTQYPETWTSLVNAARLGFFYPYNTVLECNSVLMAHSDTSSCSDAKLQQQLSYAILSGDTDAAKTEFLRFETMLHGKTYDCYFNHLNWLAMSLTNSFSSIRQKVSTSEAPSDLFQSLISKMRDCRSRQRLIAMFFDFIEQLCQSVESESSNPALNQKVELIKIYVETNYHDPLLTVDAIAEKYSLSTDYLRKVFKMATDCSLSEYISRTRMNAAAEFLSNTDAPLRQIAQDCGFSNANYFCTCFKKRFGLTPTQYRVTVKSKKL